MDELNQLGHKCQHITYYSNNSDDVISSVLRQWQTVDPETRKCVIQCSGNGKSLLESIEETDLLIVNRDYVYGYVIRILEQLAPKVKKYIVVVGTTACEWSSGISPDNAYLIVNKLNWRITDCLYGVRHAVIEFTGKNHSFVVKTCSQEDAGYTILERVVHLQVNPQVNLQVNMETNELFDLLTVYDYDDITKLRLGPYHDNGYVVVDLDPERKSFLYDYYIGCGIGSSTEFDHAFFERYPYISGSCFDGTITNVPSLPYGYQYVARNIGPNNTDRETNLVDLLSSHKSIFLKMDIEGWEFPWLKVMTPELLNNVAQIAIEMHSILEDTPESTIAEKIEGLRKLCDTHYIVHIHGNTYAPMNNYKGLSVPSVIELTFVNKRLVTNPYLNKKELPSRWDFSNNSAIPDFDLNYPPFVNK